MEKHLSNELAKSISKVNVNMVDELINICENFYNKPVHNLQDLKKRNTKLKGDIFEAFCYRYMKCCYGLTDIWFYKDIPEEIKMKLNLGKYDMGIDFLGRDDKDNYYAIQAKYRKRKTGKKTGITWKQLSTFYALALKTGPYIKHIVFTNADYVRHIGKKTKKDQTINYNKLKKIDHFKWMEMANLNNIEEDSELEESKLSLEEMRLKRLIYFEKKV